MSIRSRVSSMRRFLRISFLPLVSVIAPLDRQVVPGARQKAVALAVISSEAKELPLRHLARFVNAEIERDDSLFSARTIQLTRLVHQREQLAAVERFSKLNIAHVPTGAGHEVAREHGGI